MQKLIKKRLSQTKLLFKKLKLIHQNISLRLINIKIKQYEKNIDKLSKKDDLYLDYKLQNKISKIILKLLKIQNKLKDHQLALQQYEQNNNNFSEEDMILLEKYKKLEQNIGFLQNIENLKPNLKAAFRDNNIHIPQDTRQSVNEEIKFQP